MLSTARLVAKAATESTRRRRAVRAEPAVHQRPGGCPPERFVTLRRVGDAFIAVEIDSSPGNPHDIPKDAHSVLTLHFVDARASDPGRARSGDRVLPGAATADQGQLTGLDRQALRRSCGCGRPCDARECTITS